MKLLISLVFCAISFSHQTEKNVDYLVNLINEANENAQSYTWPTDAEEFKANGKRKNYGSYDFVIIGAGTAGSVIARRLSEIENWNVLLLEAGNAGNTLTDIPGLEEQSFYSQYNWAFNSTPQTTSSQGFTNNVWFYPRGKGLGGTTLINSLVYARGHESDYQRWANVVANERWGFNEVLKYFKKSERYFHRDPEAPYDPMFHGTEGPLRVEYLLPRSPQLNAFLQANQELGYKIADYNANKLGVSPSQQCTNNGERFDHAKAFLNPVRHRKNLNILTESYVTNIRTNTTTRAATGVEFSHKGNNYFVEAKKEVILSAGAFGSPQILMLSGIGPRRHLEQLGIKVIENLEVGSTLRDHPAFWGNVESTNYTAPIKPIEEYVRQYLRGLGPLTNGDSTQGLGMYESSYTKNTGIPDIELVLYPSNTSNLTPRGFGITDQTAQDLNKGVNISRSFRIVAINSHSLSVGTVRLKSRNPYDYPIIRPNFLSDAENKDINTLYEGIQLILQLIQTKAFKAMNTTLLGGPLKACSQHEYLSKGYWYCALRQLSAGYNHPVGTCPMGIDPRKGAVVDSEMRVFGFDNLRVADGSVLPFTVGGHPVATITMIGEQLGDLVKETYKAK